MDVFDAIYTRRSIRKFLETPIEYDKIIEVIKAGTYAPCTGNLQNWKFILEVDINKIRGLYHHTMEQEAFLTAQAAIIVVAETEIAEKMYGLRGKRLYAVQNCAAAIQNMLLAAHALDLGAVWIGAFDENKINEMYQIPNGARAQAVILLGYPDEKPIPRHLKDVWYLVNYNKYGLKYEFPHRINNELSIEWKRQGEHLRRKIESKQEKAKEKVNFDFKNIGSSATEKGKEFFSDAGKRSKSFLQNLKNPPQKKKSTKKK